MLVRPDHSLGLIPDEHALALNTSACRARCCGPGEPRGWTALVRCDTSCDTSFPVILFIEEGRCLAGFVYFWYQSVCYRCTGERLWDCQNFGAPPPGYTCAPFSFYLPGTRINEIHFPGGPSQPTCEIDACAMCVPDGSIVSLPPCLGCQRFSTPPTGCDGEPLPDPGGRDRTPYFRYQDVLNALNSVPGVLNRRCAAIRSGLCCFRVDLLLAPVTPGIPTDPQNLNIRSVDGVHEACCDCATTLGSECKTIFGSDPPLGGSVAELNCESGARRDEFKRFLCPFTQPTDLRCCCAGLVTATGGWVFGDPRCFRVLRFRAERVETLNGETSVTTYEGEETGEYATIPGKVYVRVNGQITGEIDFPNGAPCDPWFGLVSVVGFIPCGPDYTTEARGDCRNAHFVGRLVQGNYANILTYDATIGPLNESPSGGGFLCGPTSPAGIREAVQELCNDGCGGDNPIYWPPGEGGIPPGGRPAPTAGGLLTTLLEIA